MTLLNALSESGRRWIVASAGFALAVSLVALASGPAEAVTPGDCPTLSGKATLDWGDTQTGTSKLVYDGTKLNVDFVETNHVATSPNTADVYFTWSFPGGSIDIVEHSTTSFIGGGNYAFNSTIEVLAGGSGEWTWSGISNGKKGEAKIKTIEGSLCLPG